MSELKNKWPRHVCVCVGSLVRVDVEVGLNRRSQYNISCNGLVKVHVSTFKELNLKTDCIAVN